MKQPPRIETRGRPATGRTRTSSMPNIKPATYAKLKELAEHKEQSVAAITQKAIDDLHRRTFKA